MGQLTGIARFTFHPGQVEEFKRLSAQAMEIVRTQDTGTLEYDTYFNDDESEAIVIERYRDEASLMQHTANMSELMEPILATASVYGELLGELSAELKANLVGGPVQAFSPWQSMGGQRQP